MVINTDLSPGKRDANLGYQAHNNSEHDDPQHIISSTREYATDTTKNAGQNRSLERHIPLVS